MIPKQYPYQLQYLRQEEATYNEATGQYNNVEPTWTNYCKCRDEAGNGKMITGVDGSQYIYSFLIQMPKIAPLKSGTQIRILDEDGTTLRQEGTVLFSRRDQLHTRAWV